MTRRYANRITVYFGGVERPCADSFHADVSSHYPSYSGYGAEGYAENDGRTAFQRHIDRAIIGAGIYNSWSHHSRSFSHVLHLPDLRVFRTICGWALLASIHKYTASRLFPSFLFGQHPCLSLWWPLPKYRTPHPHLITTHPDGRLEILAHPH